MGKDASLVEQIQRDALDGGARIADALRKCVALGGGAGSAELRDWASRELGAYTGDVDLPDYRVVAAAIAIDGIAGNNLVRNEQISPSDLPSVAQEAGLSETVTLRQGIGELEELARRGTERDEAVKLLLPGAGTLAKLMTAERGSPYHAVNSVYWALSPTTIFGVVEQVRNKLVELAAEIVSQAGGTDPTPEAVQNAMSFVIGDRTRVNVNAAQSAGAGDAIIVPAPAGDRPWWRGAKTIWGFAIGFATVAGAVLAWLQWT